MTISVNASSQFSDKEVKLNSKNIMHNLISIY